MRPRDVAAASLVLPAGRRPLVRDGFAGWLPLAGATFRRVTKNASRTSSAPLGSCAGVSNDKPAMRVSDSSRKGCLGFISRLIRPLFHRSFSPSLDRDVENNRLTTGSICRHGDGDVSLIGARVRDQFGRVLSKLPPKR